MTDYYKLIETKFNNRIFEGISDGVTVSEKLFDYQQAEKNLKMVYDEQNAPTLFEGVC